MCMEMTVSADVYGNDSQLMCMEMAVSVDVYGNDSVSACVCNRE